MTNSKTWRRMWILGVDDPEMGKIRSLLNEVGESVASVATGGTRCHTGNVYKATEVWFDDGVYSLEDLSPAGWEIILIECGFVNEPSGIVHIDHHHPGDFGYGKPAELFLPASSLGQVIRRLAIDGKLPPHEWKLTTVKVQPMMGYFFQTQTENEEGDMVTATAVLIEEGDDGSYPDPAVARIIPQGYVLAAAADHCPAAAYHGDCPGVNPDELMRWRITTRAKFQNLSEKELLERVERARVILRKAEVFRKNHVDEGYDTEGQCPLCKGIVDLREGGGEIQELPEAAMREGLAFLSTTTDRGGRKKVVLQGATAEQINWFMAGGVQGLTDFYGDPARGFAGGYEK